ncbi:hypothetical protein SAMN05192558_104316 [Actinokineospora alba]|uniref:DUF3558 domain-containing protein n=1 Tax=Actinokineospora alba TaxID=504798 RepID=A0A1H0LWL2_9PSEU|nr:hypothetical protein [Actinokineospora alba]TDP67488.1 hypothetical protein C8E96_3033 [Actinokineospora alba]SDI47124.1 hypothetical protein SAMN05421871_105144 [Actinokineospora alba]SDO72598.1 hypothetical protein SAMN05192558_104316 [Actinokineospora alba]
MNVSSLALAVVSAACLLAGCDSAGDPLSSAGGNQPTEAPAAPKGLNDKDLCSLVTEDTLAIVGLKPADGVLKKWVHYPACVFGEKKDTRLIVLADYDSVLSIKPDDKHYRLIDGVPTENEFDTKTTCQVAFMVGTTRAQVLVEALWGPEKSYMPCDAGIPAMKDVLEAAK